MDEALQNALRELEKADINPFWRQNYTDDGYRDEIDLRDVSAISRDYDDDGEGMVTYVVFAGTRIPLGPLTGDKLELLIAKWKSIKLRNFR